MGSNAQSTLSLPYYSPSKQDMLTVIRKRKSELLSEIKLLEDEINDISTQIENMDILEENKCDSNLKRIAIGKKKFNMNPTKGINFMIENEIIKLSAEDIAYFLYHGEGLNKSAIGDYLGENIPLNIEVLKNFVKLHEFTNMILVQALRQFLWSFRLPGEAQKIDRLMECFAKHYCDCNPGVFHNSDTCYILSFSIIMLNTSLHNPSVKDKPTLQRFIEMNRGMDGGENLPDDLLTSLYNSIKKEPFKIPEDDGNDLMHTFFNPVKEGWLWKQGGRYKSWKRRWFVLADGCLYYFQYTTDKEPRGIIPLQNLKIRLVPSNTSSTSQLLGTATKGVPASSNGFFNSGPGSNRNFSGIMPTPSSGSGGGGSSSFHQSSSRCNVFEILPIIEKDIIKACKKTDTDGGKVVEGKHCVYRMSAATSEEATTWVAALTSQTKFYLNQQHPTAGFSVAKKSSITTSSYDTEDVSTIRRRQSNFTAACAVPVDSHLIKQTIPPPTTAPEKQFESEPNLNQSIDSDSVASIPFQNGSDDGTSKGGSGIHLYNEILNLRRQYNS